MNLKRPSGFFRGALVSAILTGSIVAGVTHADDRPSPEFQGMTFEQKFELMGEFTAEELFGMGTPEYGRAARLEGERHPCSIVSDPARGAAQTNTWPGGVVPYAFNANVSTTNQGRAIAAMDEISAVAPITFIPRTDETAYIVFNSSNSNSSPVGRQGNAQTINMVSWSVRFIIVHEILHSLGFWHEQQRSDRNEFVQINSGNIQPGTAFNFTIQNGAQLVGEYDFLSIMHYGQCDFSVCGTCNAACRTITVLPPNESFQSQIGQRSRLSDGDVFQLNEVYGGGMTELPVIDDFESGVLDPAVWFPSNGTVVNLNAINEPSGTRSVNVSGNQSFRTLSIDANQVEDIVLGYAYQRTGNGNSPEPGEDLVVEYYNGSAWFEIDRQLGSGVDMTTFEARQMTLPADAQQGDLRIRFVNLSGNGAGFDDYYVDDVSVTASPALPGTFSLLTPANGSSGVALSPPFSWEAAPAVTDYRLVVDDEPTMTPPHRLDAVIGGTFFFNPVFSLMDQGTEFFWRVEARNPNGTTVSTQNPGSFTTIGGPAPCRGDCDGSGSVDFSDLVAILALFGQEAGEACNADTLGVVSFNDLVTTLSLFGPCE